ncbi:response regulator transcription factor [Amycolatopsis sp. H20-H5]|uniref:response regulator transcription factor n=1 Tax=Amycolatopsis sp. H20-H5 TaxID=3046309 RepID=UPI002DBA814A|nr:response regulator transcription factor [Amycolatopsis sp. H20-H5]MEC3981865.1 response regulator transcription factor [Amycolatopsis sp. H20-H5]
MTARIPTFVRSLDMISAAGLIATLRTCPDVEIVGEEDIDSGTVSVIAATALDELTIELIRDVRVLGCRQFVLISSVEQDMMLMNAVELGVCAVAGRSEATASRLVQLLRVAAEGEATMPANVLGRLLKHVSRLQHDVLAPQGLNVVGLSERETEMLRLVSRGLSTREIAGELNYSERTVKNVLHGVTARFQLRNRSHAVAYALHEGLI